MEDTRHYLVLVNIRIDGLIDDFVCWGLVQIQELAIGRGTITSEGDDFEPSCFQSASTLPN